MSRPEDVIWEFGPFRLGTAQRLLFRNGELVPLSRKAVEILLLLVENEWQLIEKEELMRTVWPDAFVEESNLAVHISQLRRSLGTEEGCRIDTIPRRGYRFVGTVHRVGPESKSAESPAGATPARSIEGLEELINSPGATSVPNLRPEASAPMANKWLLVGVGTVVLLVTAIIAVRHYRAASHPKTGASVSSQSAAKHAHRSRADCKQHR